MCKHRECWYSGNSPDQVLNHFIQNSFLSVNTKPQNTLKYDVIIMFESLKKWFSVNSIFVREIILTSMKNIFILKTVHKWELIFILQDNDMD
jgi:hypothetical protein